MYLLTNCIRVSHQMLDTSIFGQSYHANAKTYSCHSWTTGRVTVQLCAYQKSSAKGVCKLCICKSCTVRTKQTSDK